jgi:AcrR family transcriptional regulator
MKKRKKEMDLRIQRTKKAIMDAFLELLEKKDFTDITITDITTNAMVARPTFYLHYKSKDEVLAEYLDDIFAEYMQEIHPVMDDVDQYALATALFRQVKEHANYLSSLLEESTAVIIQEKLHQYIQEVFALLLKAKMGTEAPLVNKRTNEYIVAAIAGMVYAVIRQWMEDGMLETPDMMGTLLRNISQPGILNVLKNDLS